MKLLRAATLSVANLKQSIGLYREWLDYELVERGALPAELAQSWGCPASAGAPFGVMRPTSERDVFLRFVENERHPDYRPLTSFGWAAVEICVQNVQEVNERMKASPFEIIGPPREIDGLDAIIAMQVKGPDDEIVYLTQIRDDLPDFTLPRAESMIDCLFILVMGCSNMRASLDWFSNNTGLSIGQPKMDIVYTMLSAAFEMPADTKHSISTLVHDQDVFLELDQLPERARERPRTANALPQGVAIGTLWHPDFDTLDRQCKDLWIKPPAARIGAIYGGRRAGTLRAPDGTLLEIVEG